MHKSDFVMDCYTSIPYVVKTINKLNIMSNVNFGYMHNFYHDKKDITDEMFCQYIKPLLKYIDYPALIQEQEKN